jgi:molybdenum cofactor guanylyltransferase
MNGFVLAGGLSTRMGQDKALLDFRRRPLVEHMLELLRELELHPRICGSRPDLAGFAEVVPDGFQQAGPLAGIEAALAVSDSDLNLFVPVDTPGLPTGFVRWMMTRAERSEAIATIPYYAGRPHPLCAVYSRRLQEGLRGFLAVGERKVMTGVREAASALREAVDQFHVESVAPTLGPAEWLSNAPMAEWFRNMNTPAEYRSWTTRLEQRTAIQ